MKDEWKFIRMREMLRVQNVTFIIILQQLTRSKVQKAKKEYKPYSRNPTKLAHVTNNFNFQFISYRCTCDSPCQTAKRNTPPL